MPSQKFSTINIPRPPKLRASLGMSKPPFSVSSIPNISQSNIKEVCIALLHINYISFLNYYGILVEHF